VRWTRPRGGGARSCSGEGRRACRDSGEGRGPSSLSGASPRMADADAEDP
jgi:hypothetical protein